MKAVRFYGAKDVRVDDVPAPSKVGPNQVLIKSLLCGICGTDLHEYLDGPHWTPKVRNPYSGAELPQILGHEFSAEVVEVGKEVTTVQAGDRVSIQPMIAPTTDYFGRRGLYHFSPLCSSVGLGWPWGGMAEYAVVNDYNAIPLPDDVTNEQGALIEPAAVAVQAVDLGGVRSGDTVLVTGGGPIGVLVAMAARAAGAAKIIIGEPSPGRRAKLESLGVATLIVDPSEGAFVETVRSETMENVGVDVAIECSGNSRALNQCTEATRAIGSVVITGVIHGGANVDPFQWLLKGLTVRASLAYSKDMWPRIIAMIRSGNFPVEKLIDGTISADRIVDDGFRRLLDPKESLLKILVKT
jgi:(R,R)-butanediol dehydrogenase/meso-butanediol dehydrogenase/diacetyl reductase